MLYTHKYFQKIKLCAYMSIYAILRIVMCSMKFLKNALNVISIAPMTLSPY